MQGRRTCPRCGGRVRPPTAWTASWTCALHGAVVPLLPVREPSTELLRSRAAGSRLPIWLPWPLPYGWVVTGVGAVADEASGVHANVLACSGPNRLGGAADLLLVAEDPGVGLGARYAGLPGPDPGAGFGAGEPQALVRAAGHVARLWSVGGPADRVGYAGEAAGCWLWLVLYPETADTLLVEPLDLADARQLGGELAMVPVGALSARL